MPYDLDDIGFMKKYDNIKVLVDAELTPLVDLLLKLSNIANNFSSTANRIANIDIRETHEIKEFLELTFDCRKLAERVEEAVEFRTEVVVDAAKCCYYEMKPSQKKDEGHDKDIDAIIAAGNKVVNKNVTKEGANKEAGKKGEGKADEKKEAKPPEESVKEKKHKEDNGEAKKKDTMMRDSEAKKFNVSERDSKDIDKEKKEDGGKDPSDKK